MKLPRIRHLSLLAAGGVLLYNSPLVLANSVPSAVLVKFEITTHRNGAGLDFGFMTGDTFSSLGSGWRQKKNPVFIGGTMVDFAVRNQGADKRFGTSDDQIFRLSDPSHYANQYYSGAISPWKSVNPEQTQTYYRNLTMLWDLDHDGITDLKIMLYTRNAYDGMHFVASPTPVPLPAAIWLLGSGLLSLAGIARCRRTHAC
jgi:hypothetical protein